MSCNKEDEIGVLNIAFMYLSIAPFCTINAGAFTYPEPHPGVTGIT